MMHSLPFIALWLERKSDSDSALNILSKDAHHRLEIPEIGTNTSAIEEFLPEIVQFLPSLQSPGRWLLLLEPSLPEPWLIKRWEALNLDGKPIGTQALVVRGARWNAVETTSNNSTRFLNLFPSSEFSFLEHLQPAIRSGTLRRSVFPADDMAAGHDLMVMAHGGERGLIDSFGNDFDLKMSRPMAKRIWLLACNVDAAMDRLAQRLLENGCQSVIVASADLSAPQMARLIKAFFDPFFDHNDASWLTRFVEVMGNGADGVGLTIWGSVGIDSSTGAGWNHWAWDNIHGETNRTTLHEETGRDDFFAARDIALSSQAWPITRTRMLPPLLWLAEVHDHPSMRRLSMLVGDSMAPEVIRGLAAIERRMGDYVQTAKYLSIALNLPNLPIEERANNLGQLANLFIDMNLPDSAIKAIELHEDCNLNTVRLRDWARFRRLDWMARAEARRGRFDIALDYMTTKRRIASTGDGRELAWQLYLSAWGHINGQVSLLTTDQLADEVTALLKRRHSLEIGSGNETTAYLVRALAAYDWACNGSKYSGYVKSWATYAGTKLSDEDPGPWAYATIYMFLNDGESAVNFDRAIQSLERAQYHLEASSFAGFANIESVRMRLLNRFQNRRKSVLTALTELKDLNISNSLDESEKRVFVESSVKVTRENAGRNGAFPL